MKKLLVMLMVAGIFSLVACGPSDEEKAKAEADAAAMVDDMFDGLGEEATEAEEVVAEEAPEEEVTEEAATEEEATEEAATEEETPAE